MLRIAMLTLLALAAAPAAQAAPLDDPGQPLVYVFSLDGLDGDRLDAGKAPFISALLQGSQGGQATYYRESRSIMVAETNPNHTAMATGAFGDKSGIPGNAFAVYSDAAKKACAGAGAPGGDDEVVGAAEQTDGEHANCVLAETFFESVKRQTGGRIATAGIFGKPKLADIFAGKRVDPNAYDATFLWSPCNPSERSDFCDPSAPARPNDGYAVTDQEVMDVVVESVEQGVGADGAKRRPALTFVNLPTIDAAGHGFGVDSGAYDEAIGLADSQVKRFVDRQKALGLWQRTVLLIVSDHSMDTTLGKQSMRMAFTAGGVPDGDVLVVQNGSVDMVYLKDRRRPDRDAFLKKLRDIAIAQSGTDEALYRRPNPADGGAAHTLDAMHPGWKIAGPRTGDLFITHVAGGAFNEPNPLTGNHGSPLTSDNTFAVVSGRPSLVRQQALAGEVGPRFDDTLLNPLQAQNVDVAPTVMAALGLAPPADNEGRVLAEAFLPGALNTLAGATGGRTSRAPGAAASCGARGPLQRLKATVGRRVALSVPVRADIDVFQQSAGRGILGNRRVARFRGRRGTVRWSSGRAGIYVVRVRASGDERRIAIRRTRGRFARLGSFDVRDTCSLIAAFKLESPVFGGRSNRPLNLAFNLRAAARVSVEVRRGTRRVARYSAPRDAEGQTRRLRFGSERLRRGTYTIRLVATGADGKRAVATLTARRI